MPPTYQQNDTSLAELRDLLRARAELMDGYLRRTAAPVDVATEATGIAADVQVIIDQVNTDGGLLDYDNGGVIIDVTPL